MNRQEPLKQVRLFRERGDYPAPEPRSALHGEQYAGHYLRQAIDAPVSHLVSIKVIVGQRLGQCMRMLEGRPQPLAGEWVHGTGGVTY